MADEVSNSNVGSSANNNVSIIVTQTFGSALGAVDNQSHNPEFARDYQVGSTSNNFGSMAIFRQHVDESHHDLVNLLPQQMTTILNPMMADHETKFDRLARQVERISRIIDYREVIIKI
ncbi:hypothetical protein Ahy_B08g089668 [Arachis hypogaea]|uniref:Uncharacterized protein n=1 Tax=Arachis hypogaea TaxID=3818 RepID=A0A444XYI1_ARAHY|nr:hypothetical protein Ahy_B08g089668 [Arachis hypogaea]